MILWHATEVCSNPGFLLEPRKKLPARASGKPDAETISSWSYDMEGHAKKCVDMQMQRLHNCTKSQRHAWMNDQQFKEKEIGSVWELSAVCSQIVLTCLHLARAVTKWTKIL